MNRLIVIDTETGGLDDREHSILSLGAVIWTDGELSDPFHMFVNEENIVTQPEAMAVNGITKEELASGMSPSFVVTAFEQWLHDHGVFGKQTLGGHNVQFDLGFLRRLYKHAGKKMPFDFRALDTMSLGLTLRFVGRLPVARLNLDSLCKHFDITIREGGKDARHNAAEDAVATAKLFTALLDMVKQPITT